MPAKLRWTNNNGQNSSIDIENRIFIGRICEGAPAEKRIIIDDPDISRDHAMITFSNGRLSIRDTSSNGTRLNDNRLSPNVEHLLDDTDTLNIGDYAFQVEIYDEDSEDKEPAKLPHETLRLLLEENITHLVADVRGFSKIAQHFSSKKVYLVMDEIFNLMSDIVHDYHGTIKDYAGDCIFAYWEHGQDESKQKAIMACQTAQKQLVTLEQTLLEMTIDTKITENLKLGWGITTGKVTMCHFGQRNDNVAIISDSTNLAFRLSAMANKTIDSPIVLCEKTARLIKDEIPTLSLGHVETKGRSGKESVYTLRSCASTLKSTRQPAISLLS